MNTPENQIIEIFAGTPWEAGMVQSLLESAGIMAFLNDQIIGTLNPWWTSAGGVGPVRVTISSADYEEAKAIMDEYEKNLQSGQPNAEDEPEPSS